MSRPLKVIGGGRGVRAGIPGGVGQDGRIDALAVLNTIAASVLLIDESDHIVFVNAAAELLFDSSAGHLTGMALDDLVPRDGQTFLLVQQARRDAGPVSEYEVELDTPRTGPRIMTIQVSPYIESPGWLTVQFQEQSKALRIGQQMLSRGAARSVSAMARLLAHEVKNPLSGIRGAAQLLEQNVGEADRVLTQLIRDETDRVVALVDRMDVFSDGGTLKREPVNIHQVLEHVRRVAENGFARNIRIVEAYDPSLPPVHGNRDQLVQVFLNLLKNAAEVVPEEGGEIVLSTAYQHGLRLAAPGTVDRLDLPLVVTVRDNGPGIPEDIRGHLFEPFVTNKPSGNGLGLPLVAKIVTDHGGIVEFDTQPRRTVFRVILPMVPGGREGFPSGHAHDEDADRDVRRDPGDGSTGLPFPWHKDQPA